MDEKMTVFYSLNDGRICNIISGEADMSFYHNDAEDFKLIRSFIIVPFDMEVFNNMLNFRVVEGELAMVKPKGLKYKIVEE